MTPNSGSKLVDEMHKLFTGKKYIEILLASLAAALTASKEMGLSKEETLELFEKGWGK